MKEDQAKSLDHLISVLAVLSYHCYYCHAEPGEKCSKRNTRTELPFHLPLNKPHLGVFNPAAKRLLLGLRLFCFLQAFQFSCQLLFLLLSLVLSSPRIIGRSRNSWYSKATKRWTSLFE